MTLSTNAFLPQYFANFVTTSFSPRFQESNLNGPVPIGCLVANVPAGWNTPLASTSPLFAPYFTRAVGLMIAKLRSAIAARNDADGRVRLIRTLYGPSV